jgi:MazG family protein
MTSSSRSGRNLKSSPIEELIGVMERLRDPLNGCPWDIDQNFDTIAPFTLEEAYEVVDAIERRDMDDLKNELGDLLLQVVYHAQMASELGEFDFDDVANASAKKMVLRHPHVFENKSIASAIEQTDAWEEQKASERSLSSQPDANSTLGGIAKSLPALLRAYKLQKRAARVNFDWPTVEGALDKLKEEIEELEVEISSTNKSKNREAVFEEIADVIFSAANVARKMDIDPEAALRKGNKKFEKRFQYVEEMLFSDGKKPKDATLEEMEYYWQEAKARG